MRSEDGFKMFKERNKEVLSNIQKYRKLKGDVFL